MTTINSSLVLLGGDEFVTAMLEAEKLDIPVRLGDAPQNDTLNSIKGIISVDVFNPSQVVEGAGFLVRVCNDDRRFYGRELRISSFCSATVSHCAYTDLPLF